MARKGFHNLRVIADKVKAKDKTIQFPWAINFLLMAVLYAKKVVMIQRILSVVNEI
jgi:hypothetical protein